jgi:hypothetical protein
MFDGRIMLLRAMKNEPFYTEFILRDSNTTEMFITNAISLSVVDARLPCGKKFPDSVAVVSLVMFSIINRVFAACMGQGDDAYHTRFSGYQRRRCLPRNQRRKCLPRKRAWTSTGTMLMLSNEREQTVGHSSEYIQHTGGAIQPGRWSMR